MNKVTSTAIQVPRLKTQRLILRSMSLNDVDFLFHHFSSDDVNQYSAYDNLKDREEAITFFQQFIAPGKPTSFRLGIELRELERLVGTLGFQKISKRDMSAEIGYDLGKAYWGQGIMTEAVTALIKYGFEQINLNRIEATVESRNRRSIQLLERVGFT